MDSKVFAAVAVKPPPKMQNATTSAAEPKNTVGCIRLNGPSGRERLCFGSHLSIIDLPWRVAACPDESAFPGVAQSAAIRLKDYSSSMATAVASPPPMHSEAMPRLPPVDFNAWISVTSMRAPLQPIGWPRAQAPPWMLT